MTPPPRTWRNLSRTDRLTFLYNVVIVALIAVFAQRIPAGYAQALPNLAMLALLLFFFPRVDADAAAVWRWARAFYPVFFVWFAYMQAAAMDQIVYHGFHDAWLGRLDRALFECEPAYEFAQAFPQAAVEELMHGAYFAYYALFPGLALYLYLTRSPRELDDYFSTLCGAFYFCCLLFIFYPSAGPVGLKPPPDAGAVFPTIMEFIYRWFELPGGAFPSSHVAVTVIVLVYALKHVPRWAPLYLPVGLCILPATVYCSYHYAVDVFGGIAVAAGALAVAWWSRRQTA